MRRKSTFYLVTLYFLNGQYHTINIGFNFQHKNQTTGEGKVVNVGRWWGIWYFKLNINTCYVMLMKTSEGWWRMMGEGHGREDLLIYHAVERERNSGSVLIEWVLACNDIYNTSLPSFIHYKYIIFYSTNTLPLPFPSLIWFLNLCLCRPLSLMLYTREIISHLGNGREVTRCQ